MAKKVAVPDEETSSEKPEKMIKKKRSKCCTCCLVFLIVMLVIFGAAFGVGWYFGDKYTQKYFGMSLSETFGVINDLYWTDDKDVVTRPYSAKDLDGFYAEIKRNVLLREDAPVDFDGALDRALDEYLKSEPDNGGAETSAADGANDGAGTGEGESESSVMDILVNMIADVMSRENVDIERLERYPSNEDEYIFNLNDKQLAAFLSTVLKSVIKHTADIDQLSSLVGNMDLSKLVALKQVRFVARSEDGESGSTVVATDAQVTLWLGLQDAAGQFIKKTLKDAGADWAGGIVAWLGDVVLPENIYITVSVPLLGDGNTEIMINDMNASERARAKKLINGILRLTGSGPDLDELVDEYVGKIRPYLEDAAAKMDFSQAGKGTLSLDLLSMVTEIASESMEGEKLTKSDFLYVMQALLSDKSKQLASLEPYRFDNRYIVDGNEIFAETAPTGGQKVNYERKFIEEIEKKYALRFDDGATLDDVLKSFGVSLDGSAVDTSTQGLINLVNADAFDALLNTDRSALTLDVTDRMLGAAFAGQMDGLMAGAGSGMENIDVTLDALTFVGRPGAMDSTHTYAMLAVEVDISSLVSDFGGDNALVGKLVNGLMPDSMLLTVLIDVTDNLAVGDVRGDAEFIVNSCENTDRALAAIEKLVPSLKLSEITDNIDKKLNDALDSMRKQLSVRLVPSTLSFDEDAGAWLGEQGKLALPDIFSIVSDLVFTGEDGEQAVSPDNIQAVIRDLNASSPVETNIDKEKGYSEFIDEVMDKYYFKQPDDPTAQIETFADLTTYMSGFDMNKFRLDGPDGLSRDNRSASELKPIMTGGQLGALIKESMGGNDTVQSYDIVRVDTGDDSISVTLSVDIGSLLASAPEIKRLIKSKTLYATASFRLDNILGSGTDADPYRYAVDFNIRTSATANGYMEQTTLDAMFAMIEFFASDFDMQAQMNEFGEILYNQMGSLQSGLESADGSGGTFFKFTPAGLEIDDFYTFLARKMRPSLLERQDFSADLLKSTLQGMYQKSTEPSEANANNYSVSDIIRNAPLAPIGTTKWTDTQAGAIFGTRYIDSEFNGFVKRVENISKDEGALVVAQTVVLAKDDASEKADAVRAWLNGKLRTSATDPDPVVRGSDYLVITFRMNMDSYLGGNGGADENAAMLFPTGIYITIVYKYDSAAKRFIVIPEKTASATDNTPPVIFNDLGAEQYEIMVELMGITPDSSDSDKVNIVSVVSESTKLLNNMLKSNVAGHEVTTDVTFCKSDPNETKSGMGYILVQTPTVSQP